MLAKKVLLQFNETAIHNFRTEVKKLKGLLLLAGMKKKEIKVYKLPKKLHAFYAATGIIRNLQLEEHRTRANHDTGYAVFLKNDIKKGIELSAGITGEKKPFKRGCDKLIRKVPAKLNKSCVKRLSLNGMNKLKDLLVPFYTQDSSLHEARKILKSVLYSYSYAHASPVKLDDRKKMKVLVERLGKFQDDCSSLQLLKKHEQKLHRKEADQMSQQKEQDRITLQQLLKTMTS